MCLKFLRFVGCDVKIYVYRRGNMIECEYSYTYGLLNKISSHSTRGVKLTCQITTFIALICLVVLFVSGHIATGIILAITWLVICIPVYVFIKSINKANRLLLNQNVKMVFDKNGVTITNFIRDKELANATIDYKVIKQVKVIKDLIYMYINRNSAIIVPKESFANSADCDRVIQLVSNNYEV